MKKYLIVGAAAIATVAAVGVTAAVGDRDVSISELRQRSLARFDAADANKDGQLSAQEMQTMRPGGRGHRMHGRGPGERHSATMRDGTKRGGGHTGFGPLFRRADANSDGAITRSEFTAQTEQRFQRLDTDRDGRITGNEAQAARERFRAFGERRRQQRLASLDKDGSGAVSRAEFERNFVERMARLDTNRDGTLTQGEFAAGRQAFRGQRRQQD